MRSVAMVLVILAGCDDQDLVHTPPAHRPDASGTPDDKENKVDGGGGCQVTEDCDDSNDCTLDECLENGECQNASLCGNGVCDRTCGEDQILCPTDCGSCCQTHQREGCRDQDIEQCVCAARPSCCTDVWDQECVDAVDTTSECGTCDCCAAHAEPGCADQDVSSCVCDLAPDCCSIEWTQDCVTAVTTCDGTCP